MNSAANNNGFQVQEMMVNGTVKVVGFEVTGPKAQLLADVYTNLGHKVQVWSVRLGKVVEFR